MPSKYLFGWDLGATRGGATTQGGMLTTLHNIRTAESYDKNLMQSFGWHFGHNLGVKWTAEPRAQLRYKQ